MLRRGERRAGILHDARTTLRPQGQGTPAHRRATDPTGEPAAVCQFVPSPAINGYSLDLMRRDPGEHPNGLIDYALCSTIEYLRQQGAGGLSLNFAAFRSVLDGERGDGTFTRVERWALKRLSGILPIESLWTFNAKYHPTWLPRYLVYPAAESFVPVVAATLRAESITELAGARAIPRERSLEPPGHRGPRRGDGRRARSRRDAHALVSVQAPGDARRQLGGGVVVVDQVQRGLDEL